MIDVDRCAGHGEPDCPCALFTICATCLRLESDAECGCAEERERSLAQADEAVQSAVDADIEYDRRNASREGEYEPSWAF